MYLEACQVWRLISSVHLYLQVSSPHHRQSYWHCNCPNVQDFIFQDSLKYMSDTYKLIKFVSVVKKLKNARKRDCGVQDKVWQVRKMVKGVRSIY